MNYLQNMKMWCRNNWATVGKWGGGSFLLGIIITSLVFGQSFSLYAYILDTPSAISANRQIDSKIDFSKFFSSSRVSSNDITGFLKEAVIMAVNLTILVITTTAQVLKGVLGVFKQ